MATIYRLPNGKWRAYVYLHDGPGGRPSKTHVLKSVVKAWADQLERDRDAGEVIDPRAGRVTVAEIWPAVRETRRLELASRRRDESHWRNHVEPRWGGTAVSEIGQPDVQAWVNAMERAGVGADTIHKSVAVLRAVLQYAVRDGRLRSNPLARGEIRLPVPPAHLDRVLAPDEDERLLAALDEVAGGRPHGRLLGELLLYCGLRWSEAAALSRERVRRRGALLDIGPVVERDGTIRPYPKSPAGKRLVPVPDHLWPRLLERLIATPPRGLVVPAPAGGVLDYTTWRRRWFVKAVRLAELEDPLPTPHDLRHTYGTRLAEAGVPPHEIMVLMGHSNLRSVQRYLHAGEVRFARARAAIEAVRSLQGGQVHSGCSQLPTPSHTQPRPATGNPSSPR